MLDRPIDRAHPTLHALSALDEARSVGAAGPRLRALRVAAEHLREHLLDGEAALCVRTLPLATLPYPARHAFGGAALSPAPLVQLTHRCVLLQLRTEEGPKTLLFNPTDCTAARQTPMLARLVRATGTWVADHVVSKPLATVADHLGRLGLGLDEIDYVAFDHLHGKDLRPILGTTGPDGRPPLFPNATLLVTRAEWDATEDPHPAQAPWLVPQGLERVRTGKVVWLRGDVQLGAGALLVSTPGHTAGHQTLVVRTDRGLWVCSENGVAAESWSPLESRIPGLRATARRMHLEVIPNAGALDGGTEQYTAMVVERTLADPARDAPGFFQVLPTSELGASPLAPGLAPTVVHGGITSGALVRTHALTAATSSASLN